MLKKILAVVALLACCAGFLVLQGEYLVFSSIGSYALQGPASADLDPAGNLYIVDAGRASLLRVNTAGRLDRRWTGASSDFAELDDIMVGEDGSLYALDIRRTGGGRQIAEERVLRILDDGSTELLHSEVNSGDLINRRIPQLLLWEGAPAFVLLGENSFTLKVRKGEGWAETEYPFEDARLLFSRFCRDGEGRLVGLTRNGRIYAASTTGQHELLYDAAGHPGDMPWALATDAEGRVWVSDIGNRSLSVLENGALTPQYRDSEDKFASSIYYLVSAEYGVVANTSGTLIELREEGPVYHEGFPVSGQILALRVLTLAFGGLALIGLVVCLVLLLRYILRRRSFIVTFSAGIMGGTLLLTGLFCLIVFGNINSRITGEMTSRLLSVAQLTARLVPTDALVTLNGVSDYRSEDYLRVSSVVEDQFLAEDSAQSDMYCVLYRIVDGSIAEVYSLDGSGTVNYPYDVPFEGSDEAEILATGQYKTYAMPAHMDGAFLYVVCPVKDAAGVPVALIEVGTDLTGFQQDTVNLLVELFLSIASIAVAIIMLLLEVIVFANVLRQRHKAPAAPGAAMPLDMTRSMIFLVFFAANIATSYLPLYAQRLAEQSGAPFGLSVEFLSALPISADVLFGSVASLFGDKIARHLGTRRQGVLGAALFTAGMLLKFLAPSLLVMAGGSVLSGLGWGSVLYLANLRIGTDPSPDERTRGFSGYTVSMMSGINCGVVFGAFLLNWMSYRAVLGVAAGLSALALLHVFTFMRGLTPPGEAKKNAVSARARAAFFLSPRIWPFFLCLLVPVIIGGSYLNYFFPIVGHGMGLSDSNVGYAFLLNSLAVILFGPGLLRVLGRSIGRRLSITLWGLLYVAAFLLFAGLQSVGALLLSLVLLGLADGFGLPMYSSYFTSLPEVEAIGTGWALGMLPTAENVAQALGPFLFSYVLYMGIGPGLRLAGGILAGLVLLFLATSFLGGRRAKKGGNADAG